jgi:hypothetical protein
MAYLDVDAEQLCVNIWTDAGFAQAIVNYIQDARSGCMYIEDDVLCVDDGSDVVKFSDADLYVSVFEAACSLRNMLLKEARTARADKDKDMLAMCESDLDGFEERYQTVEAVERIVRAIKYYAAQGAGAWPKRGARK